MSLVDAMRRFVLATITWREGSYAALPQFTPPTLPGKTAAPRRLGGVNMPSARSDLILSWHHFRSSGVAPQASLAETPSGTREMVENGCVGEASSPGISDFGTGRSSTGSRGAPVSRLSTKTCPIFVLTTTAGVPSFHVNNVGCGATS